MAIGEAPGNLDAGGIIVTIFRPLERKISQESHAGFEPSKLLYTV